MSRRLTRTARYLFAALTAAGLSFGADAVLAVPAPANACEYAPSRGRPGVSCSVSSDCTSTCQYYYGAYSIGKCNGGCCLWHVLTARPNVTRRNRAAEEQRHHRRCSSAALRDPFVQPRPPRSSSIRGTSARST